MSGIRCSQAGCCGQVVDGYCNDCGMAPRGGRAWDPPAGPASGALTAPPATAGTEVLGRPAVAPPAAAGGAGTRARTTATRGRRLGRGLVEMPSVPARDPATAVKTEAQVPESRRFCAECNEPVGRGRDGQAGRPEGFCRRCGHPFSFVARLRPGQLVAGQYEVAGCLAHGGMGWIYLAKDRRVADRWVVLKGIINTADEDALAAALAERRFLAEVEHPNIVKIHNFVEHAGDGYIVMEYVNGQSLRSVLDARRADNGDRPDPLPVEQAIAYTLEILPALNHLHELGLLFCDFKPDNVIRTADSAKLIDLGGVYRMDDETSPVYGTVGFQAPEIARTGPTVSSDLYTVGRSLAVLCIDFRGYQGTYRHTLPPATDDPLFRRHDSLYRFLERSTSSEPADRFQTAEEMAAQLEGVLREVVALRRGSPAPGLSTCFTGETRPATAGPDWRSLPVPLVSPEDPAAAVVVSLSGLGPEAVLEALDGLAGGDPASTEIGFRRARALIELGRRDEAMDLLDRLDAPASHHGPRPDWRRSWYTAIAALAGDDPGRAARDLDRVYRHLPGELAPKLGLAQAAERAGDPSTAVAWYDIVSAVDPGITSAAFGLARCRGALGDRAGAIAAYERIPDTSRAYQAGQVAEVGLLLAGDADGRDVAVADVLRAAAIVERVPLDREQLDRLSADVLGAAHAALQHDGDGVAPDATVLGHRLTDRDLRLGLEAAYRAVAHHAASAAERIAWVDRANQIRPRSWR